jgi:type IV pilus assembly protein PilA
LNQINLRRTQLGQGMTEYIIIVALIAVAAIGVYQAFGDVIRGQTSTAVVALGGGTGAAGRTMSDKAQSTANSNGVNRTLNNFEKKEK